MEIFIIFILPVIFLFVIIQQALERNRLLKAQLFLKLHEKINRDESFKSIERILDNAESPNFTQLIQNERISLRNI